MGTDSRTVDEEELKALRFKENSIFAELSDHDKNAGDKILSIAESMERRAELADPLLLIDPFFTLQQVSTLIARQLRSDGNNALADNVRHYLPEKYKNPELARVDKSYSKVINVIELGGKEYRQFIEKCSTAELEQNIEFIKVAKNESDSIGTLLNNKKEDLYREALNRGLTEIAGDKIRDQISGRDYRYDIPDYFGLAELNQEVTLQGNRWIAALNKFFNEKYPQRPATIRQKAWKYANAIRTVANLYETINEDKWSGDKSFWFEREFYSKIQSKHDSGNSTMFPTTLCANCSKDVDEDPKDCVRMKHWRPSPTGYLCEQCGGFEPLLRENTREQVGDKEGNVFRDAQDVLNYMPDYADVFIDYSINFKSPEIYARKSGIHGEFSKSAIGGTDKIVIPRKKINK